MINNFDLIIWDLDGTLLDTSEGILAASKYVIAKHGFEVPADDVLKTFIGPPLQQSFIKFFNVTEEESKEMANAFRQRYLEAELLKATPYDGMLALVHDISISGVKQGVATYKRQDLAEKILDNFGFADYVDMIFGSDLEGKLTKSDIIEKVIKTSGVVERDKIVMIGDSKGDQKGAAQAGIDFIGVTYGFGFMEGEQEYKFKLAGNVTEIRGMFEKLNILPPLVGSGISLANGRSKSIWKAQRG